VRSHDLEVIVIEVTKSVGKIKSMSTKLEAKPKGSNGSANSLVTPTSLLTNEQVLSAYKNSVAGSKGRQVFS
jgi:hypothetical protein